jgi:hypothetical protein
VERMSKTLVIIGIAALLAFNLACSRGGEGANEETAHDEKETDIKANEDIAEPTPSIEERGPKGPDELGLVPAAENSMAFKYPECGLYAKESDLPDEITEEVLFNDKNYYIYVSYAGYDDDIGYYGDGNDPAGCDVTLVIVEEAGSPYAESVRPESYELHHRITLTEEFLSSGLVGDGAVTEADGYRYVTYNLKTKIKFPMVLLVDMMYNLEDYGTGKIRTEFDMEP